VCLIKAGRRSIFLYPTQITHPTQPLVFCKRGLVITKPTDKHYRRSRSSCHSCTVMKNNNNSRIKNLSVFVTR